MRIIALNSEVLCNKDARRYFGWVAPFELQTGNFFWRKLGC